MRKALVLAFILCLPVVGFAQITNEEYRKRYENQASSNEFDPHDLAGIWTLTRNDHSLGTKAPPLTPAGMKAKEGRVQDRNEVQGNAPWYTCNPMGFPRLLNDDEPMELIMLPDRMLQVFQWEHRIRYIWTDGREVPSGENLENLGPAWYGHSVGKWDAGNTLVANTVGMEERAWLDNEGNPKSFHARMEETWKRIDSNTLQLQLTLHDPEYYTAPYVGSVKTYKRMPRDAATYSNWYGLFAGISEGICAPMNEVEGYNQGFRDPGRAPKK